MRASYDTTVICRQVATYTLENTAHAEIVALEMLMGIYVHELLNFYELNA